MNAPRYDGTAPPIGPMERDAADRLVAFADALFGMQESAVALRLIEARLADPGTFQQWLQQRGMK